MAGHVDGRRGQYAIVQGSICVHDGEPLPLAAVNNANACAARRACPSGTPRGTLGGTTAARAAFSGGDAYEAEDTQRRPSQAVAAVGANPISCRCFLASVYCYQGSLLCSSLHWPGVARACVILRNCPSLILLTANDLRLSMHRTLFLVDMSRYDPVDGL